jgi:hypothetical protein
MTNTANQNTNCSLDTVKSQHFDWAKGVLVKGKRVFHPYTRINFKIA